MGLLKDVTCFYTKKTSVAVKDLRFEDKNKDLKIDPC